MELTLKFFATFREAVGSKTVDREFPDASTVGGVLDALEADHEDLAGDLLVDGDLRPQINVLLNGREVLHMDGVDTDVSDGDTIAVFPPVAGGSESATETETRVESYRGISRRLAVHYLRNLGGEADGADEDVTRVDGDGWRVDVAAETVQSAGSITLTEVTVTFEGESAVLDDLVERFGRKAMRAGG